MQRYAVIMAGGVGERFWPLSRKTQPKHLWNVAGGSECLLSQTFKRVSALVPKENVFLITNVEQIAAIKRICPEIPASQIVAEPCGRDTSAAVALAAMLVYNRSKDSSFAVFPADHVIRDIPSFTDTMLSAYEVAEGGDRLVTIGIEPTFPSTGYGYIKRGRKCETSLGEFFKVARFYEKPNLQRATAYLDSGEFYWNAGIFIWRTSSIIAAIKENLPETYKIFKRMYGRIRKDADIAKAISRGYDKIEKISIDFAVMEKASNTCVVPSTFDWDDVGSWSAIERHYKSDASGNVAVGEFFGKDSRGCVVFDAANRATAIVGLNDVIVVHSADATLVCKKSLTENFKDLVKSLPEKYR